MLKVTGDIAYAVIICDPHLISSRSTPDLFGKSQSEMAEASDNCISDMYFQE